jgi:hypothetical protein
VIGRRFDSTAPNATAANATHKPNRRRINFMLYAGRGLRGSQSLCGLSHLTQPVRRRTIRRSGAAVAARSPPAASGARQIKPGTSSATTAGSSNRPEGLEPRQIQRQRIHTVRTENPRHASSSESVPGWGNPHVRGLGVVFRAFTCELPSVLEHPPPARRCCASYG